MHWWVLSRLFIHHTWDVVNLMHGRLWPWYILCLIHNRWGMHILCSSVRWRLWDFFHLIHIRWNIRLLCSLVHKWLWFRQILCLIHHGSSLWPASFLIQKLGLCLGTSIYRGRFGIDWLWFTYFFCLVHKRSSLWPASFLIQGLGLSMGICMYRDCLAIDWL